MNYLTIIQTDLASGKFGERVREFGIWLAGEFGDVDDAADEFADDVWFERNEILELLDDDDRMSTAIGETVDEGYWSSDAWDLLAKAAGKVVADELKHDERRAALLIAAAEYMSERYGVLRIKEKAWTEFSSDFMPENPDEVDDVRRAVDVYMSEGIDDGDYEAIPTESDDE